MADTDPLLSLRHAISVNRTPLLTTSSDPTSGADTSSTLAKASHLHFASPYSQTLALSTPTRFSSGGKAIDLRSIYFAWQKKDVAVPEYISSVQRLNEELKTENGGVGGSVQNLVFAERLDLTNWLEGTSEESDHIRPLDADKQTAQAAGAAEIASGAAGGIATKDTETSKNGGLDNPRLREIYAGERKMGDHDSILRGIKPTDFSHVRKYSELFLGKTRARPGQAVPASNPNSANPLLNPKGRPNRRLEPIILLSPSASSLLRMSNIKSFLDAATYIPPDSPMASAPSNILHISRMLPSIDPVRPLRFILVDGPEQFKPDYWARVVAVFTTGQTWQFKSYKWQQAAELFSHALGLFVGWRGEDVPATVRGWGRGVLSVQVDKWNPNVGVHGRWRDREATEMIWTAIEESMRMRGWGKDGLVAR